MHPDEFKLTAYAVGELEPAEQTALEEHLRDCAACRQAVDEARAFGAVLAGELAKEPCPEPSLWPRNVFYERVTLANIWRPSRWRWVEVSIASAAALFLVIGLSGLVWQSRRELVAKLQSHSFDTQMGTAPPTRHPGYFRYEPNEAAQKPVDGEAERMQEKESRATNSQILTDLGIPSESTSFDAVSRDPQPDSNGAAKAEQAASQGGQGQGARRQTRFQDVHPSPTAARKLPAPMWQSDDVQQFRKNSEFHLNAPVEQRAIREAPADLNMQPISKAASNDQGFGGMGGIGGMMGGMGGGMGGELGQEYPGAALRPGVIGEGGPNTEAYGQIIDNPFREVHDHPLSTFSIDVDTASYSNVRRFLTTGQRPPKDAVRIEELLNYFAYDYSPPRDDAPFASHVEIAECPWNLEHRLVRVALKGREINAERRPVSNLVFLLDVSGSMQPPNKLPLVKQAMQLLVQELGENDRVAIVVYAGASGLVLPSTTCDHKESILGSLERLQSGGSTAGAAGIQLAYNVAQQNFIKGGTNRVILCTDGDFNVGMSSDAAMQDLIQEKAASGVFLSVLGFGMGNLKDSKLETLADRGNGNYAYIDNEKEAQKVLVDQMSGTLVTIAKDVKIQIEFNPAQVAGYRLIGYENRILQAKDFNDDKKDAGEIGAGHTVTALYEIVPAGQAIGQPAVDALKYQKPGVPAGTVPVAAVPAGDTSRELLTLKLRYKEPDGQTSRLLEYPITDSKRRFAESSKDFRFAAAVAEFGMLLRDSPHKGNATFDSVLELAQEGQGADRAGYRAEFINLVGLAKQLRP